MNTFTTGYGMSLCRVGKSEKSWVSNTFHGPEQLRTQILYIIMKRTETDRRSYYVRWSGSTEVATADCVTFQANQRLTRELIREYSTKREREATIIDLNSDFMHSN